MDDFSHRDEAGSWQVWTDDRGYPAVTSGRSGAGNSAETIENHPSPTSTVSAELRSERALMSTRKPGAYN